MTAKNQKYQVQWQENSPASDVAALAGLKVQTYFSTYEDYPSGFGYKNPQHAKNSADLKHRFGIKQIQWLRQTHSSNVIKAPTCDYALADASWTDRPYVACAAMTADCLPIFLADAACSKVAVIHAGWRGLARGVIENSLKALRPPTSNTATTKIFAAYGPGISSAHYEVGEEILDYFADYQSKKGVFTRKSGKLYLSLYHLANEILVKNNVAKPVIPKWCTYQDKDFFPSYRREPDSQKRVANLIWLR